MENNSFLSAWFEPCQRGGLWELTHERERERFSLLREQYSAMLLLIMMKLEPNGTGGSRSAARITRQGPYAKNARYFHKTSFFDGRQA